MATPPRPLTPTAYIFLGLLARRPWSAYELARYMQVSTLRRIWPRAESRLYDEPKKLLEAGLVSVAEVFQGARKRSVYSITESGRRALTAWFAQPAQGFTYEYEVLVKLVNADHADEDTVLRLLQRVRQDAQEEARLIAETAQHILEHGWAIEANAEYSGWILTFMKENVKARLRWARAIEQQWLQREAQPCSLERARTWYAQEIADFLTLAQP